MENKLNDKAISEYIDQFSATALDSMYAEKEYVSGNDILSIPVKQVGLLTLSKIFNNWKDEAGRLQSPYFDYSIPQVRELMTKLMNTLSNNIKVDRPTLEPLFKDAVRDTLMLMFSPYKYYRELVESIGIAEDSKAILEEKKKFIRINSELLNALIEKVEHEEGVSVAIVDELFSAGDISPQDTDELIARCSQVAPLTAEILYLELTGVQEEEPAEQHQENIVESAQNVEAPGTETRAQNTLVSNEEEDDDLVENTYFVPGEISTVNQQFSGEGQETLADTLAKEKKSTLKSMLTINQKFMFINDLFDGNQEDFLKVIDFLDDCGSEGDALAFIQNNYIKRSLWREEAPAVREFVKLMKIRFS